MGDRELHRMEAAREIERVEADADTAGQEIEAARRHLASAARIADDDVSGAFAVGYDAMRKAISACMRIRGYRVAKGPGHHARTARFAVAALDHLDIADHVEAFDGLRQLRNQSEYDALLIEPEELSELLGHAEALVSAISRDLGL